MQINYGGGKSRAAGNCRSRYAGNLLLHEKLNLGSTEQTQIWGTKATSHFDPPIDLKKG